MNGMAQNFPDAARVDAYDKVRGATRYATDVRLPRMAFAALVCATVGRGRVRRLDIRAAGEARGVAWVMTHENVGSLDSAGFLLGGGFASQSLQPLRSAEIAYFGQPLALVVADTAEDARHAASLIEVDYEPQPVSATLGSPGATRIAQQDTPLPKPQFADRVRGDADTELVRAAVRVKSEYSSPAQHANPMELLGAVAYWEGDELIVHESTQNSGAVRGGLARILKMPAEKIRVVSPSLGGGFGQRNSLQGYTPLVALAARRLGRPVKLVLTREQTFHCASFRPATRHAVALGADADGRIVAAVHEVSQQTSRHDLMPCACTEVTASLYAIEHFRGRETLVRTDVQTPGFMRAPFEHSSMFAFESAMDELAHQLRMDPVELRLKNDAQVDPYNGKPFTSRHLAECITRGAQRFGWSGRDPRPGFMRTGDGMLVGWGMAAGVYKASQAPYVARMRALDDGTIVAQVGGHEMGQGMRTAVANMISQVTRVPVSQVRVQLGSTDGTPQHLTAGSWGTATAASAARQAAEELMRELARLDPAAGTRSPQRILRAHGLSHLEVEARNRAPGQPEQVYGRLESGLPSAAGPHYPAFSGFSYAAHFVEVQVEALTRRVRVARVVTVVDCGRVISPRTARSQVYGGVIWGIGGALREVSEVDERFGGFLNANLAEYVLPVNLDTPQIEVDFIDKPDETLNRAGAKGLGEVAMTGVAAAVANAVFHATGRRMRDLPIRVENLL
jgi:xanthine dehydrogenase YagR molybdenum-binding subunit